MVVGAVAAEARERSLRAATELFWRRRHAGTTMAGIAAAADVSVPVIELAFGTRATMLKAERLAPLAEQFKAQRAVTAAWIVDGVAARTAFRPGIERPEAIDVVWLLMEPAVFDRLTTDCGWTGDHFGAWFADSTRRLLTGRADLRR